MKTAQSQGVVLTSLRNLSISLVGIVEL